MTEPVPEQPAPRPPVPGPPRPRPPVAPPAPAAAGDPAGEDIAADPRVEAVLSDLERLAELPVSEHLAVYEQVHAKLREVLQSAGQDRPSVS
ncbi:hypothetical protein FE697_017565 [Mumia zhuanghuii]|uniref:Uncharacterized protein n=1 Tax=Mumia zhuanghuii TaxID=2585211 RepID=A0A5Q6RNW7_9ACTN|nr:MULTISPECIES: hypothetical protein [Mumia]KAA1419724.1 hypothetical protein FE697_017565 [Mumia zhuanghuii]